jgi:hypothetical protein
MHFKILLSPKMKLESNIKGSPFITKLTTTKSKYRKKIKFFVFSGTRSYTYFPFVTPIPNPVDPNVMVTFVGQIMDKAYTSYYGKPVVNDGLIIADNLLSLNLDSKYFQKNECAIIILDHDHSSMASVTLTPTPQNPYSGTFAIPYEVQIHLNKILS